MFLGSPFYTSKLHTFLFPTRIIGTFGQKCFTSGVHFSGMFSSESRIDEIEIRAISELSIYEQFKIS